MATTYAPNWVTSPDPIRNEIRFRISDTGPSFLFQDEEIDNQFAVETAVVERARVFYTAATLLQTKLSNLALTGNGLSELKTDDITEKFGLSEDGRTGETIERDIVRLRQEGARLNIQRPRQLRVMRTVAEV